MRPKDEKKLRFPLNLQATSLNCTLFYSAIRLSSNMEPGNAKQSLLRADEAGTRTGGTGAGTGTGTSIGTGTGAPTPTPGTNWAVVVSGCITAIGNFNVQYNFQAISIALIVMSRVQCTQDEVSCQQGHQASWVSGTAGATVFAGAILGQLTMGYAGDVIGRNVAMAVTLSIAACSALLSAILPSGTASTVYAIIIACRFLLGVGLGGIYPLSAIKAAEDAEAAAQLVAIKRRAQDWGDAVGAHAHADGDSGDSSKENKSNSSSAKAFFWQAPGAMAPWAVALALTYAPQVSMNMRWRLLLGLGTIPAVFAIILLFIEVRLNAKEADWLLDHQENLENMENSMRASSASQQSTLQLTIALAIGAGQHSDDANSAATALSRGSTSSRDAAVPPAAGNFAATSGMAMARDVPQPHHGMSGVSEGSGVFGSVGLDIQTRMRSSSQRSMSQNNRARARTGSATDSFMTAGTDDTLASRAHSVMSNRSLSYYSMRSSISLSRNPYFSQLANEKGALRSALFDSSNTRKLLATGGGWFLYDVCYYGVALFGGQILGSLETPDDDNVSSNTNIQTTTQKELIALSMAIPGALFSIVMLKYISTKTLQIYGFISVIICFVLLAVLTKPLRNSPNGLFVIYCALLFALTIPNVTTYVLPAETFPKEIRSTFNGISAACGKAGAVVGAYVFGPLAAATSYNFVFYSCAVLALLGAIVSYVYIDEVHHAAGASDGNEAPADFGSTDGVSLNPVLSERSKDNGKDKDKDKEASLGTVATGALPALIEEHAV